MSTQVEWCLKDLMEDTLLYSCLNERRVAEIPAAILDHEVILKTEVTKDGGA